ncbi:MAG: hypothetical protein Q7J68_08190 [Thermoplasmata archaeon]|nr:hypothetical protein [Thermoplasmata archaeon]
MKLLRSILGDVPNYSRFLQVWEIDRLVEKIAELPDVESRVIGNSRFGEPITALEIGDGPMTAVMIGVPHSDEPIGSLGATFFARWLATHPEHNNLGWRWVIIPVLERDGMRLNEGWFNNHHTYSAMVKSYFREPTEDQYEWTFPIEYMDYEWNKSRPETLAITTLLEKERPELLFGMHHCGFYDAYYYLSEDLPVVYPDMRKLSRELRIPMSDSSPDVPFGQSFEPGIYKMYGLREYIDYYTKTNPEYLTTLKRGACSDEWYRQEIGGFSFNCEVPMFRSPGIHEKTQSDQSYRTIVKSRFERRRGMVNYSSKFFNKLKPHAALADDFLFNAATRHLENAKISLKQEELEALAAEERIATNAEVFENGVMADLFDLFFLGQIWRVAENICIGGGPIEICNAMDIVDIDIKSREKSIREAGRFYKIPIKSAVKMQLGSLIIISEALKNRA